MRERLYGWVLLADEYRATNPCRLIFFGLTYREDSGYEEGQINYFIKRLKGILKDNLLGWFWVGEIQPARGVPHYHGVLLVKRGTYIPPLDTSGLWPHGSTNRKTVDSAWYLGKYVGKSAQKDFSRMPKGFRSYGMSVRFGGNETRERFRQFAGIVGNPIESKGRWRYIGSAVTEGYRDTVVIPRGEAYS